MFHLVFANTQFWTTLIGLFVPVVTYVLNHYAPWTSEPVKAAVLVIVTAVASGLYLALSTTHFGLNEPTLQLVVTSVVAALVAHNFFWKPSTISTKLGGGSNHQSPNDPIHS